MEDTSVSTKEKSKAVTSDTKASRQTLNAQQSTKSGAKLPMAERAEKMRDLLARLKDVTHQWYLLTGEAIPRPVTSTNHLVFALPLAGHVIVNTVTSDGKQNFLVDGVPVIPVTSTQTIAE